MNVYIYISKNTQIYGTLIDLVFYPTFGIFSGFYMVHQLEVGKHVDVYFGVEDDHTTIATQLDSFDVLRSTACIHIQSL